ncbi:S-layer homology domain-containing protein [Tumebacillus sp. ITR2]|uniref:S-layer homology domain-containing protein n=1 Tax=Tumebacillus amylolyticus TaxID=2801339 RepID=A0ABS1J6Z8_9BACL|nr:S-layer homology domain-containing protein [Tumebacillus amylolyticus]MBL0386051.1 S-layer homology domain-containing protein [Tumebacillus amylolyticus]
MQLRQGLKRTAAWALSLTLIFGTSGVVIQPASAATAQIYSWPTILSSTESPKMIVTKGVTYQKFSYQTSSGPLVLNETWTDLSDPNVSVRPVLAHDTLESDRNETTLEMAKRTGAVAGTNGDYYEISASGMALGMSTQNGNLIHSPSDAAVLGITQDNKVQIGKYTFTGQITAANNQASALSGLNVHPTSYSNGLLLMTRDLGYWEMLTNATVVVLERMPDGGEYKVHDILPAQTVMELPYPGYVKLIAQGSDAISFVTGNMKPGDTVKMTYGTNPDSSKLKFSIGGGPILLKGGTSYNDPVKPDNTPNYKGPLTGVGITSDGQHMLQVTVDGRSNESIGLTFSQMANYFAARGISDAMLLDGGGSTDMVVRQPGDTTASVANDPSDGYERRVANGLFVFSTSAPGKATYVTSNDGQAVELFKTMTKKISSYVRDENYNPLPNESVSYKVEPTTLGTISADGTFTAGNTGGSGTIRATATNGATTSVPVTVFDQVDTLQISPSVLDLGNGETQSFTVSGTFRGSKFAMKPEWVKFSTSDAALGTVDAQGLFTAGAKNGTVTVTAAVGNVTARATLGVGYVTKTLNSMANSGEWLLSTRWGNVGALSSTSSQVHGDNAASLTANYSFPAGSGLKQFVFYPKDALAIPGPNELATVNPIGVGAWVYGDNSNLKMIASFERPDGTTIQATNQPRINFNGWKFVTFRLPDTAKFPLKLDFLDIVAESPASDVHGSLAFSTLQSVYAARTYAERQPAPTPTVVTFADIQNHWGRSTIEQLATKGVISGKDSQHFDPEGNLTRAEAVTLLVRALGLQPQPELTASFTDVSKDAWYAGNVGAAVKAGIATGIGNGQFAPENLVDRNQAAAMIYNALHYKGKTPTGGTPLVFQDANLIASWAKDKVDALTAAKLLNGNGDGTLSPTKNTSRAESAVMILNMMKYAGLLN